MDQPELVGVPETVLRALSTWQDRCLRDGEVMVYYTAVDIGGTNTRFLVRYGETNEGEFLLTFPSSGSTRHLLRQFNHIAEQIFGVLGEQGHGAALSLAGPIKQGGTFVTLTNFSAPGGDIDRTMQIRELPIKLFPHIRSYFLNDLESASYGIIALHQNHELGSYFQLLWEVEGFNTETPVYLKHTNNLVMAMGTGLGVGLVVSKRHTHGTRRADLRYSAVAMEAGHMPVTLLGPGHPQYDEDVAFIKFLSSRSDNQHTAEWEDVCSGRGVEACYEWTTKGDKKTAKEISQAAKAMDEQAMAAMLLSYRYLMRAAQVTAIATQAKGIFLCGDNQVLDDPFVSTVVDELRHEFVHHSRAGLFELDRIPVYRQVEKKNINLEGCMHVAKSGTS